MHTRARQDMTSDHVWRIQKLIYNGPGTRARGRDVGCPGFLSRGTLRRARRMHKAGQVGPHAEGAEQRRTTGTQMHQGRQCITREDRNAEQRCKDLRNAKGRETRAQDQGSDNSGHSAPQTGVLDGMGHSAPDVLEPQKESPKRPHVTRRNSHNQGNEESEEKEKLKGKNVAPTAGSGAGR
jgi:hypothetical protein